MDFLTKKLDAAPVPAEAASSAAIKKFPKKKKSSVVALHGKMSQEARNAALVEFRSGKKSILIATGTYFFALHTRAKTRLRQHFVHVSVVLFVN